MVLIIIEINTFATKKIGIITFALEADIVVIELVVVIYLYTIITSTTTTIIIYLHLVKLFGGLSIIPLMLAFIDFVLCRLLLFNELMFVNFDM